MFEKLGLTPYCPLGSRNGPFGAGNRRFGRVSFAQWIGHAGRPVPTYESLTRFLRLVTLTDEPFEPLTLGDSSRVTQLSRNQLEEARLAASGAKATDLCDVH